MSVERMRYRYSGIGGDGWVPRQGSLRDERGQVWAGFGAHSECGPLRAVLMHRPGPEIELVRNAHTALWMDLIDPVLAREQHDALAALYRASGVVVHYIEDHTLGHPNLFFMRDPYAMTPEGAILARLASQIRAGEERITARTLVHLGVPILLSIHGGGTFEGGDLIVVSDDLALVGRGLRTNQQGARQVASLLHGIGISEVVVVDLHDDCMHLDCGLALVDRHTALIHTHWMSQNAVEALRRHGYTVIEVPSALDTVFSMATNLVALAPGVVVIPTGYPAVRRLLEQQQIECIEADISELMKGGGAIHCLTGILQRDSV